MPAGYSYPLFVRAKHFRLGELSGRSSVIYGVLRPQITNSNSSTISAPQINFILTNGRSFVAQSLSELETVSQSGPSEYPAGVIGQSAQQNVSEAGPSLTSLYSNDTPHGKPGQSIWSSGVYQEIILINKFGHRGEQTSIRGFNVSQTQPRPAPTGIT